MSKRVTIKEEPEEISERIRDGDGAGQVSWDTTEVDYLLSHFVEGASSSSDQHQSRQMPKFASAPVPVPGETEDGGEDESSSRDPTETTTRKRNSFPTPTTPAVQFYGSNDHEPRHPAMPAASGSSTFSVTSMAAALVTGGPIVQEQMKSTISSSEHPPLLYSKKQQTPGDTASPISPAALIGTPQENLMLPPPTQYQEDDKDREKREHLAFLQQINVMAQMANQPPQQQQNPPAATATTTNGIPPQPLPQHPAMPPPPHPMSQQHPFHHAMPPGAAVPMFPPPAHPHVMMRHHHHRSTPPKESEEKRAKRLARNRESARNSRRRKKELLNSLSKKVAKLYAQLEEERRRLIMDMEPKLQQQRNDQIQQLVEKQQETTTEEEVEELLARHSPNRLLRQAVLTFQYSNWRQLLLPRYQEFLLWMTAQPESFFTTGKLEKAKLDPSPLARVTVTKVSSKQIGKELIQKWEKTKEKDDEKQYTCHVFDAPRMWPLLCFELEVSVDQEERLLQAYKSAQESSRFPNDRRQMHAALRMISSMSKGINYQCHAAAMRSDTALLKILTPAQSVKFLQWFSANRDRCRELIDERSSRTAIPDHRDTSLADICKRLDEALRLSTNDAADEEMD